MACLFVHNCSKQFIIFVHKTLMCVSCDLKSNFRNTDADKGPGTWKAIGPLNLQKFSEFKAVYIEDLGSPSILHRKDSTMCCQHLSNSTLPGQMEWEILTWSAYGVCMATNDH